MKYRILASLALAFVLSSLTWGQASAPSRSINFVQQPGTNPSPCSAAQIWVDASNGLFDICPNAVKRQITTGLGLDLAVVSPAQSYAGGNGSCPLTFTNASNVVTAGAGCAFNVLHVGGLLAYTGVTPNFRAAIVSISGTSITVGAYFPGTTATATTSWTYTGGDLGAQFNAALQASGGTLPIDASSMGSQSTTSNMTLDPFIGLQLSIPGNGYGRVILPNGGTGTSGILITEPITWVGGISVQGQGSRSPQIKPSANWATNNNFVNQVTTSATASTSGATFTDTAQTFNIGIASFGGCIGTTNFGIFTLASAPSAGFTEGNTLSFYNVTGLGAGAALSITAVAGPSATVNFGTQCSGLGISVSGSSADVVSGDYLSGFIQSSAGTVSTGTALIGSEYLVTSLSSVFASSNVGTCTLSSAGVGPYTIVEFVSATQVKIIAASRPWSSGTAANLNCWITGQIVSSNNTISITSFAGTSGTLTFTNSGTNNLVSGETVVLSGFSGGNTGLNGQSVTVLAAGLNTTTFEATVTGSGYASGAGSAASPNALTLNPAPQTSLSAANFTYSIAPAMTMWTRGGTIGLISIQGTRLQDFTINCASIPDCTAMQLDYNQEGSTFADVGLAGWTAYGVTCQIVCYHQGPWGSTTISAADSANTSPAGVGIWDSNNPANVSGHFGWGAITLTASAATHTVPFVGIEFGAGGVPFAGIHCEDFSWCVRIGQYNQAVGTFDDFQPGPFEYGGIQIASGQRLDVSIRSTYTSNTFNNNVNNVLIQDANVSATCGAGTTVVTDGGQAIPLNAFYSLSSDTGSFTRRSSDSNIADCGGVGYLAAQATAAISATTGAAGSINNTNLCGTAKCPAGRYRVDVYIDFTAACGTSGTLIPWLSYTDDSGARAGSSTTTYFGAAGGLGVTPATSSTGATLDTTATTHFLSGTYILNSTGAAAIQYGTTQTVCGSGGPMAGNMYLSVFRIQ